MQHIAFVERSAKSKGEQMNAQRITIYPKDIQRITGKSERYGRMLIRRIKTHLNKQEHQFVTIDEFCSYTGIKQENIREHLIG